MKVEIEIDSIEVNKKIKEGVNEYLSENGLLRLIKNEINRMYKGSQKQETAELIRKLSLRVARLENKYL